MAGSVEQALQHVRHRSVGGSLPQGLSVTLNFHPDTIHAGATVIERLAQCGLYRSQFETGISNGGLTAYPGGDRWVWENRIFGGAYDAASPALRPKYGALNHHADPAGGSPRFGSCHLRVRPEVLARTTFCYPDSHLKPGHFGTADQIALIGMVEANALALDRLDNYIEAHVHGTLHIADDVEAIVLDPCYQDTEVEKAARRLPCAVEWHDGFRLSVDRRDDCEHYRGVMAADALAGISVNGIVTPLQIGAARAAGLDVQVAKWVWHCLARFGR
jgi:hypothetical protein